MKLWTVLLALVLTLGGMNAEAKRLAGGKSVGQQSNNVTQRQAAPAPAPAAPPVAAQPARKPWGAMLGGLAAGLGLAWLAHSMGFGEGFGQFMMIALLVLVAMVAFGWFMRNRRANASGANGANGANGASPFAFQGAGGAATPQTYRPENVGNDASARPWERSAAMPFEANANAPRGSGVVIGSALGGSQNWGVPADFDTAGFLTAAKANFVNLQAAWDKEDIPALRVMMTDQMLQDIKAQLDDRESHTGGSTNHTEVDMLEAQLLGIEDLGADYMASVEFSGMIREQPSAGPSPFREVWNMTKPKDGSRGWLVAGVQALQ